MGMEWTRWSCNMVTLALWISLSGSTPLTAQGNCQAVNDAMDKIITTPTHIYSVTTPVLNDGSKPRTEDRRYSETVYLGGSTYTKVGGKWTRGRWTAQQVMKKEEENRQNSKYSCHYLRDEPLNSETATVYNTHSERKDDDMDIKSDGLVWISKSRGLPMRHEFDIDVGDSDKEHREREHHSVRYDYTNVQPPM